VHVKSYRYSSEMESSVVAVETASVATYDPEG